MFLAGLALGCEDGSHRDIGDEINIVTRRNDALVAPATARLAGYGRRAIPQLETALHTAAPTGRLHLIEALSTIADEEAVPVLRHVALYDVTLEVREAAEAVLVGWTKGKSVGAALQLRATAAIAALGRLRARGEGPLLWGDAGAPGAPTTVGAPEPVGPAQENRR